MSFRVHQRMRWQQVWHMAVGAKAVYLEIRPRRYWCGGCGKAFTEPYEQIGKWSRRSKVGEALLLRELKEQNFGAVRRKTGWGYRTLRVVVERAEVGVKWAEVLQAAGEQGIYLGIDEHSFRGQRMVGTITEVSQRRVLGLLRDDRQKMLRQYLAELPDPIKVEVREVAMDINEKGRMAIEKELKGAKVVVDPFHVIQDANRRVDDRNLLLRFRHRTPENFRNPHRSARRREPQASAGQANGPALHRFLLMSYLLFLNRVI